MKGTLLIGNLPRIVVPVARRLAARGIPVYAASIGRGLDFRSRALRSFTILPDDQKDSAAFFASLRDLIARNEIDTIMPCGDECLRALAAHDEKVRGLVTYCAPPAATVLKILHKPDTLAIADEAGVPVPRDYNLPDIGVVDAMRLRIAFPVIVKPHSREGEAATGIKSQTVHSFGELRALFERFPDFGKSFLIQDYIPGYGVAVNLLMQDGDAVVAMQHRRLREYPIRGGVSVSATTEAIDPELLSLSVKLLRALEWEGVAMVEFRRDDESGRLALMEVNGRFWGSISLALHSGVDFPWYLWQIAHGQRPAVTVARVDARFRWLGGDLRRTWEGLTSGENHGWRAAAQAFGDCVGAKDSIWSWSDPLPGVQDFIFSAGGVGLMAARFAMRSMFSPVALHKFGTLRQAGRTMPLKYAMRTFLRSGRFRGPSRDVHSVVFICHGNIMRSPMAEALLRAAAPGLTVESAGTCAIAGSNADPRALQVAREFGVSLENHRARPVTTEMIASADLLVVMDYVNYVLLTDRFPEAASKTVLFGSLEHGAPLEIDDPYAGNLEDVRVAYRRVQTCSGLLAEALRRNRGEEAFAGAAGAGSLSHPI